MIVVVSLYAAAGCVWLMLFYWGRLRLHGSADSRPSLPIGSVGFLLVVLATVLFMAAIGPSRAATVLAGLMPTSGGTWWDDPEARGGVNDGDNEVAASEKPESVGFTESETLPGNGSPQFVRRLQRAVWRRVQAEEARAHDRARSTKTSAGSKNGRRKTCRLAVNSPSRARSLRSDLHGLVSGRPSRSSSSRGRRRSISHS